MQIRYFSKVPYVTRNQKVAKWRRKVAKSGPLFKSPLLGVLTVLVFSYQLRRPHTDLSDIFEVSNEGTSTVGRADSRLTEKNSRPRS